MATSARELRSHHPDEQDCSAVGYYLADTRTYPVLSNDETRALIPRAQDGDKAAFDRIVEGNLRLVIYIAKRYIRSGYPFADIIQVGNEGLMHAITKFDCDKDNGFATYATFWIRQRIMRGIDANCGVITIPAHVRSNERRMRKAVADLIANDEPVTDDAICAISRLTQCQLAAIRDAPTTIVSIDAATNEEENQPLLIGGLLASDDTTESVVFKNILSASSERALAALDRRERQIIGMRFGLNPENETYTRDVVAKTLHLSYERARQLEAHALRKLRMALEHRQLAG